ncbi:MAG: hypothetical protein R3E32_22375 [Chitinophagales bacterium]
MNFLSKFSVTCFLFAALVLGFASCNRENPCDVQVCANGECILAIDSVATIEGANIQISDTLTQAIRILEEAGTVVHQNTTLTLARTVLIAPNLEISRTTHIANSDAVINLFTYTACDCFTGWDGVKCDIPAPCDGRNCLNGGIALEIDEATCRCDCPLGFTGDLCETEDKCALITCSNNSHCEINEGTGEAECVCDAGYDFPCSVQTRQKFLGTYNVTLDSCSSVRSPLSIPPYTLVVEKNNDNVEQIVFNSFNSFGPIAATVFTNNTVSVQDTTAQMDILSSIEGSFNTTTKTINLLLLVKYANGAVDTCKVVMKRQ